MNRREATEYCKANTRDLLTPSKKKGQQEYFCCDLCGSGLHGNRESDGALTIGNVQGHLHCHACGFDGDIFDYMAKRDGLTPGTAEAFNRVYELFGLTIENDHTSKAVFENLDKEKTAAEEKAEADYIGLYRKWGANIESCSYLKARGISLETAKKYMLGYTQYYFTSIEAQEWGLVIPTSKSSYVVRNTNKATQDVQRYMKKGEAHIFNEKALGTAQDFVFVTEGELDALSILQAGGVAVGIGSTSNIEKLLIPAIKKHKPKKGIILAFDNDEAGKQATNTYFEKLREAKLGYIKTYVINICGGCKDANELLVKAPQVLEANIQEALKNPDKLEYDQRFTHDKGALAGFWERIHNEQFGQVHSTGFKALDEALGGGIGTGLTGLGAIPALGKTTLAVQIACNFAKAGKDVLIFSMELGRDELMAKTLSRLTATGAKAIYGSVKNASTSREILSGWRWWNYPKQKQDMIWYAKKLYEEYADRIYTVEGELQYTVEQIRERVGQHVKATGNKPIVFVDYLQVVGLDNDSNITDKKRADILVKELRRIARDYDIPVITISSFNRENYNRPVNMTSFKESGGIEYTADFLIGLQYSFMERQLVEEKIDGKIEKVLEDVESKKYKSRISKAEAETKELKKKGLPYEVQAVVLKSRYSPDACTANFNFLSAFNLFFEGGAPQAETLNKELVKASSGRGKLTAQDVLRYYIKACFVAGEYSDHMWSNRAQVRHAMTQEVVANLEAVEGENDLWYIKDTVTMQVLESITAQDILSDNT